MGSSTGAPPRPLAHCAQCGTKLDAGDRFCPECGSPVGDIATLPPPAVRSAEAQTTASSSAPAQKIATQERLRDPEANAELHLKRAYQLIGGVEKAAEGFRASALAHNERLDADQPFLDMMVTGFKGKRQLEQQKSTLLRDLQLGNEEIDRAAALDLNARIDTEDGALGIEQLRAMIWYANGQLELIWGSPQKARGLFTNAIQLVDFPDAHYMLGLIYEDEYKPAEALKEFEKCLSLDPSGELSVPALREANAMRNYKKKFRGNWLLLFFLCLYIVPGILYWRAKYK
jgi:tetratricopeptide (TPR) repeat protein